MTARTKANQAQKIIAELGLKRLPVEGGLYIESYRASDMIPQAALPARYKADKPTGTAIYYCMTPGNRSIMHRLPTDEIYHFYLGDPVTMLLLYPDGRSNVVTLGQDILRGAHVQMVVPRGVWQGLYLNQGGTFALMGTTMAPGFDTSDFEAGVRGVLLRRYPKHADLIVRLTPPPEAL